MKIKFICKLPIQIAPFNESLTACFESKHYLKKQNIVEILALNSKYVTSSCTSIPEHKLKGSILEMCDI